ncbi:hypothetical protein HLH17_06015 [Acinetobacter sp. ANC 5380]|jgi:hypothetical protein|uniref:Bleomycin resistance protein n=1 Tax=Acinetobacter terrae TaxID=2731247 RepID=A0A7Y2REJ5_9GAMM|nr:hypothetical protein [Acinetobacter terrae]NNH77243.1 hypothetical protein [Acinetobacter terrae]
MDYIAANLPAINFDATCDFYRMLGFQSTYQSNQWMILHRGSLTLEFFHHPALDLKSSWHSACIRVEDLPALYQAWQGLNWAAFPQARITGIEHLTEIEMLCVIDINGSLLRCIQQH